MTPTAQIHLSSSNATAMLESKTVGAGQSSFDLKTPTSYWRFISQGSSNGNRFDIFNQTTLTQSLSIASNNNVGI
jgi:hypothetical protein